VKAGLDLLGAGVGDPRRPLLPLDDEGRAALEELLAKV
jgi:4-hydroxy-tetrahydrodipicolinate synthase